MKSLYFFLFFGLLLIGCTVQEPILEETAPNKLYLEQEGNTETRETYSLEIIASTIIPEKIVIDANSDIYVYNLMNTSKRIDAGDFTEDIPADSYTIISNVQTSCEIALNGVVVSEIVVR